MNPRSACWHGHCSFSLCRSSIHDDRVEMGEKMKSSIVRMLIASAGLLGALPAVADAQVALNVQLVWEWGDGSWHAYRPVYVPAPPVREVVYHTPRARVRVPPGHMPPPGLCRAWYPGRPPGHQPRPERCERLFRRHFGPGVVILGAPGYGAGWEADYAYDDDRGRGRGRGRRGK
jgi:hypothetical protein